VHDIRLGYCFLDSCLCTCHTWRIPQTTLRVASAERGRVGSSRRLCLATTCPFSPEYPPTTRGDRHDTNWPDLLLSSNASQPISQDSNRLFDKLQWRFPSTARTNSQMTPISVGFPRASRRVAHRKPAPPRRESPPGVSFAGRPHTKGMIVRIASTVVSGVLISRMRDLCSSVTPAV
jgi:hypothetical protein